MRIKLCHMKVQTIQKITCNFREKIQNFAMKIYWGPESIVVAPHFLIAFKNVTTKRAHQ